MGMDEGSKCSQAQGFRRRGRPQSRAQLGAVIRQGVGVRSLLPRRSRHRPAQAQFCALWTEICMAFPALDTVREGSRASRVVDARLMTVPGIVEIVLSERVLHE